MRLMTLLLAFPPDSTFERKRPNSAGLSSSVRFPGAFFFGSFDAAAINASQNFNTRWAAAESQYQSYYRKIGFDRAIISSVTYSTLRYSTEEVKAAGKVLVDAEASRDQRANALKILDNWRSVHAYPLQTIYMTLSRRARKVDSTAIMAQRRKRLASIENKLRLMPHLSLTRIQDIGGCRAILKSVSNVQELAKIYDTSVEKDPRNRPQRIKVNDYIAEPKGSGYRSLHYVYEYNSDAPTKQFYKGLKIEIQIRSQLQHIWATAVETVSEFQGFSLKSGIGDQSWKRFFVLMSSVMALKENAPTCPDSPSKLVDLKEELRQLCSEHNLLDILVACGSATEAVTSREPNAYNFLLKLDSGAREISIMPYMKSEQDRASADFLALEEECRDNRQVQVVLVSVSSVQNLKRAYPNYFLDIGEFTSLVQKTISPILVR